MTRMNSFYNLQPSLSAVAIKPTGQMTIASSEGSRELIMIVDDEDFVTLLAERVLREQGYRVITARNGFQALDLFKKMQSELQLVILDFVMPIMGGGEVLAEMLKINPEVPVLLTSGFTSEVRLKELLSKQLCGFIPKPLAQKKLLHSVRSTIDAARAEGTPASRLRSK
jgi:DNA-binding NtrC family response regulator